MSWLDDDWRHGLSPRQKEYLLKLAQAETQVYHRVEYHWRRLHVHIVEYRGEVFDGWVVSGQTTGNVIPLSIPYWWWLRLKHALRRKREAAEDKKFPIPPARLPR